MAKRRRRARRNRSLITKNKVKKAIPVIATGLALGGIAAIGFDTYQAKKSGV